MFGKILKAYRAGGKERGSMLATAGLLMPVFLGVMALAVDMSYVYTQRRLVENAADASAIAGATVMGRRAAYSSADHETYAAITQTQRANLTNQAETYAYWSQAWYVVPDGTRAEMVGVPCGDLASYANQNGGVQVVAQRSVPTFFAAFLPWNASGNYATNERQTVTITANPTQGTFYLTVSGGDFWTTALPYNATPAQVQAALEALPQIGSGNVQVTSPYTHGGPYTVVFRAGMSNLNVIQLQGALFNADHGATLEVATVQDGSGWRKEVTVGGMATAMLQLVTGVPTSHSDFAPYMIWVGSRAWKGYENTVATYYHPSSFVASWVNKNQSTSATPDPNWAGSSTSTGYLGSPNTTIRTGSTLGAGGAGVQSASALQMLQDHFDRGEPVIMPVVTNKSGNGSTVNLSVVGFAFVKLDYSGAVRPTQSPAGGLQGKIVRWTSTGFETGTGSGTSTGTTAPAKTVSLVPNN